MGKSVFYSLILLTHALVGPSVDADTQHSFIARPKSGDNFTHAEFHLLVPRKVDQPRYILVLVPGFNGDGRRLLQHRQWGVFAETTGGAILACTFKALPEQTPEEISNYVHYAAAQHGSGAALENAIEQLDALDTAHSFKGLPLLVYGHSAGGQFAYGFSCHNPNRMVGFAAAKGGYYYPEPVAGTYEVPGLVISGEQDLARRRKEIRALFESHRRHGAPWCWMEDAEGHGTARTLDVIIPYFRELLRIRLPSGDGALLNVPTDFGVTVDLETKTIRKQEGRGSGQKAGLRTAVLPSLAVFEAWAKQDNGQRKFLELPNQAGQQ